MGEVTATWQRFRFPAARAKRWKDIEEFLEDVDNRYSRKAVYVIRTLKPFSIAYPNAASPTLYIGEGHFEQRLDAHRKWIEPLSADFPDLGIEVFITEIKMRKNGRAYKDVEADLLDRFQHKYGTLPLINKQKEYHPRSHSYPRGFFNPLFPESGAGYKWALAPLISNSAYPASLRGRVG